MKNSTRVITLSALFTALSIVFLYFASVWVTGQLGLVAFSSMFVAAAVIEMGIRPSVLVFIVSSLVGVLILPNRTVLVLYLVFFGYYPIVKSLIEKLRLTIVQWSLKLVVFNVSLTVLWFFFNSIIINFSEYTSYPIILFVLGSAVFALYDYGFTKAIWLYIRRVSVFYKGK